MKIAVIYLGRRGAGGRISLEISRNLPESVERFVVISAQAELLEEWRTTGLNLVVTPTFDSGWQMARSQLDRRAVRALAEEIRRRSPDVLFFTMAHPWNHLLQGMLDKIPSVVMVHDPVPHPGLREWVTHTFESQSIQRAGRCVVLSRAFLPVLAERGVPREQVDVAPHGALAYNRAGKLRSGLEPVRRLLFFGRILPYKGLEVLLEAYRRVVERTPDASLTIAGEGDMQPYMSLADDLPNLTIENRWIAEEEIPSFFEAADLVVVPYTSASQSGVIGIAASFGLPVAATGVGGIPEQIIEAQTGRLARPGSVDDLAQIVEELMADPQEAWRLGSNLAQEYAEKRSWPEIASKVAESCQRAAQER